MDKMWKCPLFNTKSQQKNKEEKTELNFKEESDNIEVWTFKSNFFLSSLKQKQTEWKKIIMMKKKKKNKQKQLYLPVILSKTKHFLDFSRLKSKLTFSRPNIVAHFRKWSTILLKKHTKKREHFL
jgi:hypothetical protein